MMIQLKIGETQCAVLRSQITWLDLVAQVCLQVKIDRFGPPMTTQIVTFIDESYIFDHYSLLCLLMLIAKTNAAEAQDHIHYLVKWLLIDAAYVVLSLALYK